MFTKKDKSRLEIEIDQLVLHLKDHNPTSEEYGTIVDRMMKLHKLEAETQPEQISRNTMLSVGANLLGIAMIIKHENVNVITSKALGFVKLR